MRRTPQKNILLFSVIFLPFFTVWIHPMTTNVFLIIYHGNNSWSGENFEKTPVQFHRRLEKTIDVSK